MKEDGRNRRETKENFGKLRKTKNNAGKRRKTTENFGKLRKPIQNDIGNLTAPLGGGWPRDRRPGPDMGINAFNGSHCYNGKYWTLNSKNYNKLPNCINEGNCGYNCNNGYSMII